MMKTLSLLQASRQARGWTQTFVAEQLGVTELTVGRWERGETTPQMVYRQRLCDLFHLTPKDLGFDVEGPSPLTEGGSRAPFIDPLLPPLPARLVGREKEQGRLKRWLCTPDCPSVISLYGLPGVGKTAVMLSLLQDREVTAHFDGILWASLGPQGSIQEQVQRWATLLEVPEMLSSDLMTLVQALRVHVLGRRLLVLIDDVWRVDDLMALQLLGAPSVCLVTTRSPLIAAYAARRVAVRALHGDGAFTLLRQVARVPIGDPSVHALLTAVGGLPLALTLMGQYLRVQTYNGSSRRLREGLDYLQDANHRLLLQDIGTSQVSLQRCIERSIQTLSDSSRHTLAALSRLPNVRIFSEEKALRVLGEDAAADLDALCDAGVLELVNNRYHLHPVIADYARCRLMPSSARRV